MYAESEGVNVQKSSTLNIDHLHYVYYDWNLNEELNKAAKSIYRVV